MFHDISKYSLIEICARDLVAEKAICIMQQVPRVDMLLFAGANTTFVNYSPNTVNSANSCGYYINNSKKLSKVAKFRGVLPRYDMQIAQILEKLIFGIRTIYSGSSVRCQRTENVSENLITTSVHTIFYP